MPSVTVQMGSSPKPTCAVSVTPSLSGTTLTLTCEYTLNAINGYSYWGFGVRLQYSTNGTSWSSKNLVSESTSQWATKKGTLKLTYSSVTADKKIYFRLASYPDGGINGSSKNMTISVRKLTVAKGSNISSVSISAGSTYNLVGTSCKVTCSYSQPAGYTISSPKWTSSNTSVLANYSGAAYSFKMPSSNITLTASATKTAHTYTVKYVGNGSTGGSTAASKHTYGVSKALTANGFTRTGYTFKGWAKSASATTAQYTNKQSVLNLSSVNGATVTLYAVWQANTYTVKYNGNGNTGGSPPANSTHTYGTSKALNTVSSSFVKTGHTFQGWAKSTSGAKVYNDGQSVLNLTASNGATVNLYAVWKANTYTVAYNGNGSTSGSTASSTHTYGVSKALTTNGFTRTGYHFMGWATSGTGSKVYNDRQSVLNLTTGTGTVTLFAVWEANKGTAHFHPNGGTATPDHPIITDGTYKGFSSTTQGYLYTETSKNLYDVTTLFTRTGYSINASQAWRVNSATSTTYLSQTSQNMSGYAETNNAVLKLYANWIPKTYTVNYDINIGSITIPSQVFTYDQYSTLPSPDLSSENYIFVGWKLGTKTYNGGQKVKNLSTGDPVTLTCLAVPRITGFTIYKNINGEWVEGNTFAYGTHQQVTSWWESTIKMYLSGGWKV